MTASPYSNTYTPYRWARVVSGETWAEYAVGLSGLVEAKTTHGPLILWATKTGEEESLPVIEAPTPSPLEVQAARVNVRAHFQAFARAAHGRVRHSVRWKTNQRHRNYAILLCFVSFLIVERLLRTNKKNYHLPNSLKNDIKRANLRRAICDFLQSDDTDECLHNFIFILKHPRYPYDMEFWETLDRDTAENWYACTFKKPKDYDYKKEIKEFGALFVRYLAHVGRIVNQKMIFQAYSDIRKKSFVNIVESLNLIRQQFLDVLRRCARPAPRAHRVPRPNYAQPRPPTAPLAPPVA